MRFIAKDGRVVALMCGPGKPDRALDRAEAGTPHPVGRRCAGSSATECSWARFQPSESADEQPAAELWRLRSMRTPSRHILWPGWATWALIAVVVT